MKPIRISIIVDVFYQNNQIFNECNTLVNRDDCMRPWIELKKSLALEGILLNTVDVTPIGESDIVFFINIPDQDDILLTEALQKKKRIFCMISELDLIHKQNSNIQIINLFDRVFTYQTNLVDGKKIFKINYSFDFAEKAKEFSPLPFKSKKFCTIISGNKTLNCKNELYSERVRIIRWYEKNHPSSFDLYGMGWNVLSIWRRIRFNHAKFGFFKTWLPNHYPSYKGRIKSKKEVLSNYKFSFCLENASDVPGWITEKIFDSLFNGCIPIYQGALEINTFVSENCFIDYRKYTDYEELHQYLYTMDEDTYNGYIANIRDFLIEKANEPTYEFGIPYFIDTIKHQIR